MESTPRRRWFRFRLRTLLVLVVALTLPLGWIAKERRQYWIEQRIAAKLRSMGIDHIDCFRPNKPKSGAFLGEPSGLFGDFDFREWLRGERIVLIVARNNVDEIDLAMLEQLPYLDTLSLKTEHAFDLSRIAGLKRLRQLYITGPVLDLEPLAKLPRLRSFHVASANDIDLKPLANLTELRTLSLDSTPISDLSPISKLQKLEWLLIRNTRVTDLTPLKSMPNLRELDLRGTLHSKEQVESLIRSKHGLSAIRWGKIEE